MSFCLNIGNASFQCMTKGTYIDKTEIISVVNRMLGTSNKRICVTRPRRFGKTFAMKALVAYYGKSCDSRHLFENYRIATDPTFELHLNKYNVIWLEPFMFMDNTHDFVHNIKKKITSDLCTSFPEIPYSDDLSEFFYNIFNATGEKFIFLIDAWDILFREATENTTLQNEYMQFLRYFTGN